jgi:probable phosphoglycerate mutase
MIFTSPLQRCTATAAAIAAATGSPQETLGGLSDLDYGSLQWKSYDEVKTAFPELYETWFKAPERVRFPGGESLQDLVSRTTDVVTTTVRQHPHETVVMVAHDNVNRALLLRLLDLPLSAFWRLSQAPCCINTFEVTGSRVQIHSINETCHLDGQRDSPIERP